VALRAIATRVPHVMVGDRPSTDGRFARTLGATFGLVLSGVTRPAELPVEPNPDFVGADLRSIVETITMRN